MNRSALLVLGIAAGLGLLAETPVTGQVERSQADQNIGRKVEPQIARAPMITSVSQVGYGAGHTDIVIEGRGFPETGGQIWLGTNRTVPSSPHTATKMAGTLSFDTEPGKTYKVALYRNTTRMSNEVDYFLLYQLHDVAQGARVKPGDVVDVRTSQRIGERRLKTVRFGSQAATIVAWDPATSSIRVRVPEHLPPVSSQPITVQEGGKVISNTITVTVSAIPEFRK